MDVIIFSGQSNMQGSTGEKGVSVAENCFEYKYLADQLVTVKDPVGEDIGEELLRASSKGGGSLVPSFCRAYSQKKGSAVAIHCAKGNTSIAEWKDGSERYNAFIEKAKRGLIKVQENFELGKVYLVWLQGESDALYKNTEEGYCKALIEFKNAVKRDLNIDKFGVIKTGYFAEYAEWVKDADKTNDLIIMAAQERAAKEDEDIVILTDICKKLSLKSKYLNPKEHGPHYNNAGMEIIGRKAGKALAKIK